MRHFLIRFLVAGLLAGSLLAAETYKVHLSEKVQLGKVELQPGKYLLVVDGSTAVLKDKSGTTIEAKAKVEQTTLKSSVTKIGVSTAQAVQRLESITPEGGRVRVVFE